MDQSTAKRVRTEDFIKLAVAIKRDELLRARLYRDPLAYLDSIGVTVDDCFKEVVQQQLKLVARASSDNSAAPAPKGSFAFTTKPWGLVLAINEDGMQWLQDAPADLIGKAIDDALRVLAESSADPIIAALVLIAALWCGTQAVWILAEYGMMLAMDQSHHQGVYLTWTWVGLALKCYVPFPTPIT